MTRKTWPLLLGCFVVPALLIAACSSGGDSGDDDDSGDYQNSTSSGNSGNNNNNNNNNPANGSTGNNVQNTGRGGFNPNPTPVGQGGNRFTNIVVPTNSGGVLARGGASFGGNSSTSSSTNPFNNLGGSTAASTNKAGSAGNAPSNAGSAGKSGSGVAGLAAGGSGPGGAGGTVAAGGVTAATTGVAGSSSTVSCPEGCAVISVPVADVSTASFAYEMSLKNITGSTQIKVTAVIYAPNAPANVTVRLIVDDAITTTAACTSTPTELNLAADDFYEISQTFTCSSIESVSFAGFRIYNTSGGPLTLTPYVESIVAKVGSTTVEWNPTANSSVGTAPGDEVLGPTSDTAGATIAYQKN